MSSADHGTATLRAYCRCGAKLTVTSDPPAAALEVHALWRSQHEGPGHGPADARTAARERGRTLARLRDEAA